jgi:UDP-N-acetyl-D-glucosamine dehydrogenase
LSAVASLVERIWAKQAKVGIIGFGYVGLPLAVEFARAGLDVTGFDVDEAKITSINQARTYIPDVPDADLAGVVEGRMQRRPNTPGTFTAGCWAGAAATRA